MNATTLIIIELLLCITIQTILYKRYKSDGLYAYTTIALIIASIMSLKTITIYNFDVNLGLIPFVTIFTTSNILIQKNGPEVTKKLILIMSSTFLISYTFIYLIQFMDSSNINLFTSASYDNIFVDSLRMYFTNFVTMLYSLLLNSKLYYYLKKTQNSIIVSNIFSTIIIQFLAATLFGIIAFAFLKDPIDIIKIIMIRYLISLIVGISGTIVVLMTKKVIE